MKIVGLDFSINKPAACLYNDGKFEFISWPFGLTYEKEIFRNAGVLLFDRTDEKYKGKDSSEKMRWEVGNARYLAKEIVPAVLSGTDFEDTKIVFEGIAFASKGNMAIQLGGYKYILMDAFHRKKIPFSNMYTYAPITIKKTAGASKKGMGKKEMIDSFVNQEDNLLSKQIKKNPEKFQKKTGKWIDHLDDLVDAYWTIHTYIEKEISPQ